jgi:hypothetical protein
LSLTRWLEIDGERIGEVLDMEFSLDSDDAIVTKIPAGNSEVIVPITLKNVDAFMEVYRKMFRLSDSQVFKEFIDEGGVLDEYAMDRLNILTLVLSRDGEAVFPIRFIVFEDGSVLSY